MFTLYIFTQTCEMVLFLEIICIFLLYTEFYFYPLKEKNYHINNVKNYNRMVKFMKYPFLINFKKNYETTSTKI